MVNKQGAPCGISSQGSLKEYPRLKGDPSGCSRPGANPAQTVEKTGYILWRIFRDETSMVPSCKVSLPSVMSGLPRGRIAIHYLVRKNS